MNGDNKNASMTSTSGFNEHEKYEATNLAA